MVYFDTHWNIDYLFVKSRDEQVGMNLPLLEVIPGALIKDKITAETFAVTNPTAKEGEPPETVYKREGFRKFLSSKLKIGEIEAFALQPEGENTTSEVYEFLEKYDKR